MNQNFIQKLAEARVNALTNQFGDAEYAKNKVAEEMSLLTNANPSNTTVAGNAGNTIPTAVALSTLVETAPAGRWSFISALTQGRQSLFSATNEYPIMGDVEAAGGTTEWTTGGFHDDKEATEGFNSEKATIIPK